MQAKIHLIIISAIILVIFLIWYVMYGNVEKKAPIVVSGYAIEIARASYGVECDNMLGSQQNDAYRDSGKDIIKENNVLPIISKMCNNRAECSISVNDKILEFPTDRRCGSKLLEVEYRCFKVDRIRRISGYEGDALTLDCKNI